MASSDNSIVVLSSANLRAKAANVIYKVAYKGESLAKLLPEVTVNLNPEQTALIQALVYGSVRHYLQIKQLIQPFMDKPIRNKELVIEALIVLGVFQLLFSRVKDHAAINETVNATKNLKRLWAKGLINAVLRSVQRQADELQQKLANISTFPQWLIARIEQDWPQQAAQIFINSDIQAPMSLRVHPKLSVDEYLQKLADLNIAASKGELAANCVTLTQATDVLDLPGFALGHVSVQDQAAQLAGELLPIKDGMRVLDACAAPGGKSIHLLQQAKIELIAIDQDPQRLERVQQNLERCDLQATLIAADASDSSTWFDGQTFDAILLDAPCSATGVIRRHPDIKLLRKDDDIEALALLQKQILDEMWSLLKPGGHLLYATCSILKIENETQMVEFLAKTADASEIKLPENIGVAQQVGRQLFADSHDGFYYALLQKNR